MIRFCIIALAVLVAAPGSAQGLSDVPQYEGVYLEHGQTGALQVVDRPHASMPLAATAVADSSKGRTRWESARRGAGIGALVGIGVSAVLIAGAAYSDLSGANVDSFVPATLLALVVALPIVGTSTLVGSGIGYATGGD